MKVRTEEVTKAQRRRKKQPSRTAAHRSLLFPLTAWANDPPLPFPLFCAGRSTSSKSSSHSLSSSSSRAITSLGRWTSSNPLGTSASASEISRTASHASRASGDGRGWGTNLCGPVRAWRAPRDSPSVPEQASPSRASSRARHQQHEPACRPASAGAAFHPEHGGTRRSACRNNHHSLCSG
ncbi:hypothetical protein CALVIDRAFT_314066 [Calocera viscosa TUFC12733]|uniref:Uncharacterized protein n=1 Tax=Calocera viscosa (strain TUFC12733) TaxID=1330018 RepID=A0A167I0E5_CALVF|nr:hypothetical protein CALVIDRAFT_314066 [Calocera viscosa TUFC12733]